MIIILYIVIVDTIGSIDDLIEKYEEIVNKIEFLVDKEYEALNIEICDKTLESCFDISIGRTPPRAEKHWFTTNNNGIKWLSIKDMGNSNSFIFDTSEKITNDAIKKYNYTIVKSDDILMSFKLTIGRVAIAGTDLVTNEAIACFKPKKEYLRWYLYCYLKHCDFENAGSTSSIAIAINSSILKKYPFKEPNENSLIRFNNKVSKYFKILKELSIKINHLKSLKTQFLDKYFK